MEKENTKQQQVAVKQDGAIKTALLKQQEYYVSELVNGGLALNLKFDDYQKLCASGIIAAMADMLKTKGTAFKDIDQSNIAHILQTVAIFRLNPTASPRECYLEMRGNRFNLGVEGDGNDKILREYGVDVAKVHRYWVVRENDLFTYPSFSGLKVNEPTWTPKDYTSKVVRVVYPIEKTDGTIDWIISEREEVGNNLKAHIANNLLNKPNRQEVIDQISPMTFDALLKSEFMKYTSPAWRNGHSQEAMILRKMRNNCTKKYPKNFENVFVEKAYEKTFEDYDQYRVIDADIEEEVNVNVGTGEVIEPSTFGKPKDQDTIEDAQETPTNTTQKPKRDLGE